MRAPHQMILKVYLVDVSFLPVYIEIKLKFYTIYYTAQMVQKEDDVVLQFKVDDGIEHKRKSADSKSSVLHPLFNLNISLWLACLELKRSYSLHCYFTRLNHKGISPVQFCLNALLVIHRNPKQKYFLKSSEGFLRAVLTWHCHPSPV